MRAEPGYGETIRIDLALVGFGHVARRFVTLLDERADRLARDHGLTTRIVGIATARHGAAFAPGGLDWRHALAIIEDDGYLDVLHDPTTGGVPESGLALIERHRAAVPDPHTPRVVVETTVLDIERGQPAIDHVRAGLASGAHVITANKGPVAFAYRALDNAARAAGRSFLFEGTVMDGVPVFNLARQALPTVTVQGFRGVLNSTTNHILTAIEDGKPFEEALAEMQQAGVAEANPWLDVDGWDAAAKTAALANVLMGVDLTPQQVDRTGIGPRSGQEAVEAVARGERLRLVASAERRGTAVAASVRPVSLPANDLLAGLRGQANALVLDTDLLGRVAITQLDGGLTQTAYALVSDLVEVRRRL